ncbi:ATP/GTP-binding protein [Streptomyces xiamenensis]|uniref:ATP/GTP-binding protein n=1 Tax=Streptomyces xiamenensis TaxID=408015 RepID=UPI0035DFCF79
MYYETCGARVLGMGGTIPGTNTPIVVSNDTGEPVTGPTPAELAQQAVDQMDLEGPDIQIAPDPTGTGTVGVPVWMWTAESPTTTGPSTASASAGGITVTAIATAQSIEWSMGDGTSVTCEPPGTAYEASMGMAMSPDCGHKYGLPSANQPGGTYSVSGTTTWRVPWEGGGESGVILTTRTSSTELTIGQLNVLN